MPKFVQIEISFAVKVVDFTIEHRLWPLQWMAPGVSLKGPPATSYFGIHALWSLLPFSSIHTPKHSSHAPVSLLASSCYFVRDVCRSGRPNIGSA